MKDNLKITGTKDHVDIEIGDRTARFWGDLCVNGFAAIAGTMEWLTPNAETSVSNEERSYVISALQKYCRWKRFKVFFVDEKGRRIR